MVNATTNSRRLEVSRVLLPMPLSMENIVAWNIREMNTPNKERDVLSFCLRNKIGLPGLVKTKGKVINLTKVSASFPNLAILCEL